MEGGGLQNYKACQPTAVSEDSPSAHHTQVPDNMGSRFFLALFLALLVLGNEVQGTEEDDPGSTALLDTVFSYWNSAKAVAGDLYQKTYLTSVDEKLRDMYSKSSAAMTTYAGIFTDQLLTLLKGE